MPRLFANCYFRVWDQPFNPLLFQNVPTQYDVTSMLNFELKLRVRFLQRCSENFPHVINLPSSPLSSHYISMNEFFENGSSFLQRQLSHRFLEPRMLDVLIPRIIDLTRQWQKVHHPCPSRFEDGFVAIPLAIEVVVELRRNVNLIEAVDHVPKARMVPMTEGAIRLLDKINLLQQDDDDGDGDEKNECCICLEGFCDGVEISKMPCQHAFHHHCIVQWLKTSHLCPLCRYHMPVAINIV